jgi:hypothetical protein
MGSASQPAAPREKQGQEPKMTTAEQVRILSKITTKNEAGRHFMEIYSTEEIEALEADGLLTINRPIHDATGISYSQEYWSVEVTDDGVALVEANPEDWDA